MSDSTPAISVRHLSQRYGKMTVIHDVTFDVARGEIFGFIGPNGAGKTTTIRTLSTLHEPYAGQVFVCGIDVAEEPAAARRLIGYMADHAGVYERITVLEYLEFFARASHVYDPNVIDAVIELVDLGELRLRLVAALSKGMRQRLQIARVLLHDPEVLILDEPASDLDPRARIELRDLLLELRELGKTIFLSSHILTELSDVCTSVAIIEQGRLLVSGPIGTLAEQLGNAGLVTAKVTAAPEANVDPMQAPGNGAELTQGGAVVPEAAMRRLKIRVLGSAEPVRPLLEACPPVRQVTTLPGGQLSLRYMADERFVAELVRYLVHHGVPIVAVEPERSELERIFLEVTRGQVQ
jgi:ABC-2 type transport system ATP-binding protein